MDFAEAIDNSDLEAFGFTDDFIIELWGSITDAKQGRLKSQIFIENIFIKQQQQPQKKIIFHFRKIFLFLKFKHIL